MAYALTDGATLACTSGSATGTFSLSAALVTATDQSAQIATMVDAISYTNIPTFGTCLVLTAAANGVTTPCSPVTAAWLNTALTGSLSSIPIATTNSMCVCCIGGVITCSSPGKTLVSLS